MIRISRSLSGLAAIVMFTGLADATPDHMSERDWRSISQTILDNAVKRVDTGQMTRSGAEIAWRAPSGASGMLVYQPIVSRETDEVCDGPCQDPCRHFTVSYEQSGSRARYSGLVCATDGSLQTWRLSEQPALVSFEGPPQGPSPPRQQIASNDSGPKEVSGGSSLSTPAADMNAGSGAPASFVPAPVAPASAPVDSATIKVIQTDLKRLDYYAGDADGQLGASTTKAVDEFASDEGLPSGLSNPGALVQHLSDAVGRSDAAIQGGCPNPTKSPVVACARESQSG